MRRRAVVFVAIFSIFSGRAAFGQGGVVDLPTIDIYGDGGAKTVEDKVKALDKARDTTLSPKLGATAYTLDRQAIQNLPQGEDTPLDKVVLQAPGVSYDSALSNPDFHIRNEYSFAQYRINGIPVPVGVPGLGTVFGADFIGGMTLLDGVLPAQYGLRTAGVLDMTTKDLSHSGGSVSLYAGSQGTVSPSLEYGGTIADTQYYFSGRFLRSDEGLESATPTYHAFNDRTDQAKGFAYISTLLGDSSRLTYFGGLSSSRFQIPTIPGQTPLGDFGGLDVNSATVNDREHDRFVFNVLALQTHAGNFDGQFALLSSYANVHYTPDVFGDLAFYDASTEVGRSSFANGAQFDGAYKLNADHTLRFGFVGNVERTEVDANYFALPLAADGSPEPTPQNIVANETKVGLTLGVYAQDEWRLSDKLTLNAGLRFDQLYQYVDANQLSPRLALTYKPVEDTSFHIGYARYFTPPAQSQAAPTNLAQFANTTLQPSVNADDPVKPERSHYFDAGVDKTILPGLTIGADVYYKLMTDTIDDGQFGPAPVLTMFNYAHGVGKGVEFKAAYQNDGFRAYFNFSANKTQGKDVVSNQYLFDDPAELAYAKDHYIYLDDAQTYTISAGASYRWGGSLVTADMIYGSGLRAGFANLATVKPYTQVNLGLSHQFNIVSPEKPLTARFDVINLFDNPYLLRDGDGIGQFAPQYGPRRGFYFTLTQKL